MHAEPCMAEKPPACRADAGLGAKRMHGPAGPRRATGRARTGRGGAPRLRQAKRWPLGGEAQVDGLGVGVERVVHAQVLYRQAAARGVVVALRGGSQDLITLGARGGPAVRRRLPPPGRAGSAPHASVAARGCGRLPHIAERAGPLCARMAGSSAVRCRHNALRGRAVSPGQAADAAATPCSAAAAARRRAPRRASRAHGGETGARGAPAGTT